MKYCEVATPFKGVRVYVRCAMGMPCSETALEELLCRVLGDCLQDGIVAKLADDLYCGGNTIDELYDNWKRVLSELQANDLCLSASKTVVAPTSTTILGWKWNMGTIQASQHRLASLSTCERPTVKGMRSFIGAYKVLSRVLPKCSSYVSSLDEAIAGQQSSDKIKWSDALEESFQEAQKALSKCRTITLPRASDQLWIVTDGAVRNKGIGATLYVVRNEKVKVTGFYSAKLKSKQHTWLPCEIEALSIAMATSHFSPRCVF